MLQQTQVDRVVPFFSSFLDRFPTVQVLASASIDDVLASWGGLGYYRRARHLHAAARQIVTDGAFPSDLEGWLALPGVGPYTAAAVTSITLGQANPVLDGNVERVLSRFSVLEVDPKKAAGRRRLTALAGSFLDSKRPGDSNQALMELGATVCRPRAPRCSACPLSFGCVALKKGEQERYPLRTASRKTVGERRLIAVVERDGKILRFKTPDEASLLAGLWELPWVVWSEAEAAERALGTRYGGRWCLERACGWVRHSITFRDIRGEVWLARVVTPNLVGEGVSAAWHATEELESLAASTLVAKALSVARDSERGELDG